MKIILIIFCLIICVIGIITAPYWFPFNLIIIIPASYILGWEIKKLTSK